MYTTLAKVKAEDTATETIDDDKLIEKIRQITAQIDRILTSNRPVFEPYTEARRIPLYAANIESFWGLYRIPGGVKNSLFSLSSVSINGTAVTGATLYYETPDQPARAINLPNCAFWSNYCNSTLTPPYITITGIWGWNPDYASAWDAVDTLTAGIDDSVTTITVNDVDGADLWGETPRFSSGNIIKVDDEIMLVLSTNTTDNEITVRRGWNGTTAALHLISAPVSVWQLDPELIRVASRQVCAAYAKQGAFDAFTTQGGANQQFQGAWLNETRNYINGFNYL